ncbi:hypothetical protein ABTE11_22400, partial [Acinetobacter baumannii]
ALLAQAPILVLDEATSALDRDTEAEVLTNLASVADRQTRIIIAHRPASIASAGRVLKIIDGRSTTDMDPDTSGRRPIALSGRV